MSTKYKGVLIDDEVENRLTPITDRFENSLSFKIDIEQPEKWEASYIRKLAANTEKYNCIILDWRLDEHQLKDGYRVTYKAAELCQLIRRKAVEKKFQPVPIFLWSTDANLEHSYFEDFTSHDLFDWTFKKDTDLRGSSLLKAGRDMIFFIEFYKVLLSVGRRKYTIKDFLSILGLTDKTEHWLDERAKVVLDGKFAGGPPKIPFFSKFIYRDIIKTSGVLISENLLAIRLGIDREKSANWKKLIEHPEIKNFEYDGFFKDDENRLYWMQGLYELWGKLAPNEKSLFLTDAPKRTEVIVAGLEIKSLFPIKRKKERRFWFEDANTKVALDPDFSEPIKNSVPRQSWHDPKLVTAKAKR